MKVATPHWLPDGDKSSAGISVSATATKKACSVGVSVSNGSTSGGVLEVPGAVCASAATGGAKDAATAVPAPMRKLRRRIGLLSSAIAPSRFADFCRCPRSAGLHALGLDHRLGVGRGQEFDQGGRPFGIFRRGA